MKFFVALAHPNGHPAILSDEDETPTLFASEEEAEAVARGNTFAQAWGHEIYPWPHGKWTDEQVEEKP